MRPDQRAALTPRGNPRQLEAWTSRRAPAAGSAFTYRYLKRQPTTPAEQAQHPEPAQHGG